MTTIAINGSASEVAEVLRIMGGVLGNQQENTIPNIQVSVKIREENDWNFDSTLSNCLTSVYNF